MIHPFVVGEVMLSGACRRRGMIEHLRGLPAAPVPRSEEIEVLIVRESLDGQGIGYVDVTLLAAVQLKSGARLWTLDRKLRSVAAQMGIAFEG